LRKAITPTAAAAIKVTAPCGVLRQAGKAAQLTITTSTQTIAKIIKGVIFRCMTCSR
jgi:hypothetical protein